MDLTRAAEALDPGARALMNLWVRRGLDDAAIAQLAGGSPEEVAQRRQRIVEQLATEVDAAPGDVRAALEQLAAGRPAPAAPPTPSRSAERADAPGGVVLSAPPPPSPQIVIPTGVDLDEAPAASAPPALILPASAQAPPTPAAAPTEQDTAAAEPEPEAPAAPVTGESPFTPTLAIAFGAILFLLLVLAVVAG